jgi:hypothetical protein
LIASLEAYASAAAEAVRLPGVTAAVYNNALLQRQLGGAQRARALNAMEAAYAAAGVAGFAAWVDDSDDALRLELEARGYALDTSTRAMAIALDDVRMPAPQIDAVPLSWSEHLDVFDLPRDLLANGVAGSTTWGRSNRTAGAAWRRRSPHSTSATPARATAGPQACTRPRWPSTCTRASASATSGATSSTSPSNAPRPRGTTAAWCRFDFANPEHR